MSELKASEQTRFRELQNRQDAETLSSSQAEEYDALIAQLEREEMARLRPGLERQDTDNARDAEKIRALSALIERKAALAVRLEKLLDEVQAERAAINQEVAAVTEGSSSMAELSA